jgi:chemotaxis-related protein WspB
MLFLLFQLDEDRYALEAQHIVEVLPVVHWKTIPTSATGVLGVFNYHGKVVPLLDLAEFILGQPSRLQMSTRIILVNYRPESTTDAAQSYWLGLLVEGATRTIQRSLAEFVEAGVEVKNSPYLGPVATDAEGIVQLIDIHQLLPENVQEQLFQHSCAAE